MSLPSKETSGILRCAYAAYIAAFAFVLCVMVCYSFSGCSATEGSTASSASGAAGVAVQEVTDAYGRVVCVPADAQTCATVGSAARIAVYAGAADKLVAVTQKDTPASSTRPYTVVWADAFAALPTTSNGNHLLDTNVDAEALLALAPDVIISSRSAQECDDLQNAIGIPVVGVSYQDSIFGADVYASIRAVGAALGTSERAEQTVAALQGWSDDLATRTADIAAENRVRAYVGAVNYKGAKSFGGTVRGYAPFDAANVANVADGLGGTGSVDVDVEQIAAWDPDIIFLNDANITLLQSDYASNRSFFDSLRAFKTGALYTQPSFNYNGTNVELGVCDAYFVAATAYPDAFADVDLPAKYDEVFRTLLGSDYYETMRGLGMDFARLNFTAE